MFNGFVNAAHAARKNSGAVTYCNYLANRAVNGSLLVVNLTTNRPLKGNSNGTYTLTRINQEGDKVVEFIQAATFHKMIDKRNDNIVCLSEVQDELLNKLPTDNVDYNTSNSKAEVLPSKVKVM